MNSVHTGTFLRWLLRHLAAPALLAPLVFLAVPCHAYLDAPAQELTDLNMEELMEVKVARVYGASKFEQKETEAPASVSVVTADEIKRFGYRNLSDIIASQRGFYTTYDRNYAYLGARGVDRSGGYNTRVLVLVDGHRTNENMYDTAFIGNEFVLDVDLIERVEFIRGPGSSLYGDNAFFAVINIITRHGQSLDGLELAGAGGSFDSYKGRMSYGKYLGGDGALSLSGSIYDSQGNRSLFFREFNDPQHNNGLAHGLDYERTYNLFGTVSLHGFTLQGAYASRTKGVPTASFDSLFDTAPFFTVDNRGYLDLRYDRDFENGWNATSRFFYDSYYYHENIPFGSPTAGNPPVTNFDSALNEWWGTELKVSRKWAQHQAVAGVEYQGNLVQRFENHDISPYHQNMDIDRPTWRWASYLQDEYTIIPQLILNAGARYDYYSTFGATVSPRAALIYSPWTATRLKAIYGEAFRAPNSYELVYAAPEFQQKGNPFLKPEKIRTAELIWEQVLDKHFHTTLSAYSSRISHMINQVADPADGFSVFENAKSVRARGVEAELEGKWLNGLLLRGSYSLADARDDATGKTLVDSPRHLAKLNMILPVLANRLFTGVELQYTGRRKTLAGSEAGGFVTTNLTLFSQRLFPGLELSATIYNLFDKKYGDPGSLEHRENIIQQDGRVFRAKLSYSF